ncbi:MAG: 6-carboxytetrahydropterin synthase [Ignavibacteriales bacterium]|nr:6-carboxytetrahydropterin synthase [Ignavibacteriales bacterium]
MTVYVTRRARFSAAHRLSHPDFSNEKNLEVFGGCSNPNGHGHNYELEVTVAGEPDPLTGYVIDLKKLKALIEEHILAYVDHKNLNIDVEFLSGINPTAENIAVACWHQLLPHIQGGRLHSVRLRETENNVIEYRGE